MTNFEIADTDTDPKCFEIADTDADTDMKIFETADTDADTDMNFSKNRGHGHGADKPRTRVSTDLCLEIGFGKSPDSRPKNCKIWKKSGKSFRDIP